MVTEPQLYASFNNECLDGQPAVPRITHDRHGLFGAPVD